MRPLRSSWPGLSIASSSGPRPPFPSASPPPAASRSPSPGSRTNPLESPSCLWGVIGRMALEIFLFRSLFRNTDVAIAAEAARLRQRQMALVFRPSLSLVASDHRAQAPAFLHRTDCPLDQRPVGSRRILRDRHPDPLSERCRPPRGADVSVSPPDGRPAGCATSPCSPITSPCC